MSTIASTATSPFSFELLPNELWAEIFTWLENPNDFNALALVDKRIREVSKQIRRSALLPSYVANTIGIHGMTDKQKMELAYQVGQKFVSSGKLLPVLLKENFAYTDFSKNFNPPLQKEIVGDYLALIPPFNPKKGGLVQVYNLNTQVINEFEAHIGKINAFALTETLLITVSDNAELKTWNLRAVVEAINPTPVIGLALKATPGFTPLRVHNNLMAMKFNQQVLIADCTNLGSFLRINFSDVTQIEFTDNHLMLVSKTVVTIWDRAKILEGVATNKTFTQDSALCSRKAGTGGLNFQSVKMHGDRLLFTYAGQLANETNIAGELWNWTKKEQVKLFNYPYLFQTMDIWYNNLVVDSGHTTTWDLDSVGATFKAADGSYFNSGFNKIYVLSRRYFLQADPQYVLIKTLDQKLVKKCYNLADSSRFSQLVSFDLNAKYLLTETQDAKARTRTIIVYHLMA